MDIWIPEPLYFLFPWIGLVCGVFFVVTAPCVMSMVLGGLLIGYGGCALFARAIG